MKNYCNLIPEQTSSDEKKPLKNQAFTLKNQAFALMVKVKMAPKSNMELYQYLSLSLTPSNSTAASSTNYTTLWFDQLKERNVREADISSWM